MNSKDKISKSAWNLIESAKDSTRANIYDAIKSGELKIESASVAKLLHFIDASIDQGYHKGHKTFMKTVDVELNALAAPKTEVVTKKNKV